MCRTSWSRSVPSWLPSPTGLTEQRAAVSDEKLTTAVEADTAAADAAAGRVAELAEQLAAKAPEAVAAELADAVEVATALGQRHDGHYENPA